MKLVLDSSVVLSALLEDEQAAYARLIIHQLKQSEVHGVVPGLFLTETANGLLMAQRRGRLDKEKLTLLLKALSIMPFERVELPDVAQTTALAQKHQLTVYDATYLHIALREGVPLASLDGELRKAALAEGVYYQPVSCL